VSQKATDTPQRTPIKVKQQMTPQIEQIIEQLKTAQTSTEIARATVRLLRACGIYNFQLAAQEMARMAVTHSPE
jgi:hypothetical protein